MLSFEILPSSAIGLSDFARVASQIPRFRFATRLEDIAALDDRLDLDDRRELSETLEQHLAAFAPNVAVLDALRALARPGSSCVVTGQQPGLLGGPLYSLFKALHAIRLARSLSQAWERPVAPLFWNHADDHDVAEVHHAWLLNENLDLQRVALAGLSSGRQPLSRIRFEEEKHKLGAVREAVRRAMPQHAHLDDALDAFMPREHESFATATTRALTDLLGPLGLVVLEPDWIRTPMSRALARISAQPIAEPLAEGERVLVQLGLRPAIESANAALLFRVDQHGRHALRLGGEGFRYEGEEGSRTATELAAEIVDAPLEWSPGALLRPLVQDSVLPSVAYVGGWGELEYLAQLGPLRAACGVPSTAAVPRWSCTLIEPETAEALAQLGVTAGNVIESRARVLVDQDDTPAPQVVVELREIAARAAKELVARKAQLAELDRGLAANLPRTADQIRSLVEKICEKAERVDANRRGRGKRLLRRAGNTLCPRGELQERILGPLPFVARWGTDWIGELFERMTAMPEGHLLASFEAPPRETK
ncbi:MAG: bacillithiol biosynthesis cysteine-adding enzyme BshC [Planctomycetes bacterium]|nr:bacillithiol biosynthesis cysteine-adding enzyme BshC [Planctomycetota bacterium]